MLTVFYSCHDCKLVKVPVQVPERENEDIKTWMDALLHLLAQHHRRVSPYCFPKHLHDLMIPVTGADKIGRPAVH